MSKSYCFCWNILKMFLFCPKTNRKGFWLLTIFVPLYVETFLSELGTLGEPSPPVQIPQTCRTVSEAALHSSLWVPLLIQSQKKHLEEFFTWRQATLICQCLKESNINIPQSVSVSSSNTQLWPVEAGDVHLYRSLIRSSLFLTSLLFTVWCVADAPKLHGGSNAQNVLKTVGSRDIYAAQTSFQDRFSSATTPLPLHPPSPL